MVEEADTLSLLSKKMRVLEISIPGDPVPQGRGRAVPTWGGARVVDPRRARDWKKHAKSFAEAELLRRRLRAPILSGAVAVELEIVHARPASEHRTRRPPVREWCTRLVGDVDNVAKAVLDSLNGLLWDDDRQVAALCAKQYIGAQGEAPGVWIRAWQLQALDPQEDR